MKKIIKLYSCLTGAVLLLGTGLCSGCSSSLYSDEKHLQRIKERAEERYLGEDSEYTGLEVYPLYDEYEEMEFALIELEPQGFVYVSIAEKGYPWKGMYTLSEADGTESWMPYRVKEGANEKIYNDEGQLLETTYDKEFFRDENGDKIVYFQSPFKVAGIEDERRYLLSVYVSVYGKMYIPAVERGDQYLDLIDGELIDYEPEMETTAYAVDGIYFIWKGDFDL